MTEGLRPSPEQLRLFLVLVCCISLIGAKVLISFIDPSVFVGVNTKVTNWGTLKRFRQSLMLYTTISQHFFGGLSVIMLKANILIQEVFLVVFTDFVSVSLHASESRALYSF